MDSSLKERSVDSGGNDPRGNLAVVTAAGPQAALSDELLLLPFAELDLPHEVWRRRPLRPSDFL